MDAPPIEQYLSSGNLVYFLKNIILGCDRTSDASVTPPWSRGKAENEPEGSCDGMGTASSSSARFAITKNSLYNASKELHESASKKEVNIKKLFDLHRIALSDVKDAIRAIEKETEHLSLRKQQLTSEINTLDLKSSKQLKKEEQKLTVRKRIGELLSLFDDIVAPLEMCIDAASLVEKGNLYLAQFRLCQLRDLHAIAMTSSFAERKKALKALWKPILESVMILEKLLVKYLHDSLNNWLLHARSISESIGQKAVEEATESRKNTSALKFKNYEGYKIGDFGYLNALDNRLPLSAEKLSLIESLRMSAEKKIRDYKSGTEKDDQCIHLNLWPLTQCVEAAYLAGNTVLQELQLKYIEARKAQLGTDMTRSFSLENHDPNEFVFKIVGYFILEAQVLSAAPMLGSRDHSAIAWEGASSAIIAEFALAFEEEEEVEKMLELKCHAVSVCDAIDSYCWKMLDGAPSLDIRKSLRAGIAKYCSLVIRRNDETFSQEIANHLDDDSLCVPKLLDSVNRIVERVGDARLNEFMAGIVAEGEIKAREFKEFDSILAALMARIVFDIEEKQHDIEYNDAAALGLTHLLRPYFRILLISSSIRNAQMKFFEKSLKRIGYKTMGDCQVEGIIFHLEETICHIFLEHCQPIIHSCFEGHDFAPEKILDNPPPEALTNLKQMIEEFRGIINDSSNLPETSRHRIISSGEENIATALLHEIICTGGVSSMNAFGTQILLDNIYYVAGKPTTKRRKKSLCPCEKKMAGFDALILVVEAIALNKLDEYIQIYNDNPCARKINKEDIIHLLEMIKDTRGVKNTIITRHDALQTAKILRQSLTPKKK